MFDHPVSVMMAYRYHVSYCVVTGGQNHTVDVDGLWTDSLSHYRNLSCLLSKIHTITRLKSDEQILFIPGRQLYNYVCRVH